MFLSLKRDRNLLRLTVDIANPIKWFCSYDDILLCVFARTIFSLDEELSTTTSCGFGPENQQGTSVTRGPPSAWLETGLEANHACTLAPMPSHWNGNMKAIRKTKAVIDKKKEQESIC